MSRDPILANEFATGLLIKLSCSYKRYKKRCPFPPLGTTYQDVKPGPVWPTGCQEKDAPGGGRATSGAGPCPWKSLRDPPHLQPNLPWDFFTGDSTSPCCLGPFALGFATAGSERHPTNASLPTSPRGVLMSPRIAAKALCKVIHHRAHLLSQPRKCGVGWITAIVPTFSCLRTFFLIVVTFTHHKIHHFNYLKIYIS